MQSHELRIDHLAAGYDNRIIIPDMNITLPDGKISVIIGPNGCGKSTLLKTMCRLNKIASGSILLDGKDIGNYPAKEFARRLGLLPQSPVVPEGISVVELVSRGRFPYRTAMRGMSKADYEAVEQAMERMEITGIADRNVDELSGGQRQRVWIALALAQQTDILFLDEPTTFLDIAYQVEILELLVRLNRERNTTIAMVLHDINLSARYADHIFALKDGKLIADGTPEEVITQGNIREIFGIDSVIIDDPVAHTPMMVPIGRYACCRASGIDQA